ncbi:MAG: SEL1-like repeat protein [Proteobacteria bacterium]|nr:SEL1-like repeat protein [Pseudomonadota bacterium]
MREKKPDLRVQNLDPKTRAAAEAAARAFGLTIKEWVGQIIHGRVRAGAAQAPSSTDRPTSTAESREGTQAAPEAPPETAGASPEPSGPAEPVGEPPARGAEQSTGRDATDEEILAALDALSQQVDAIERHMDQAVTPLGKAVKTLEEQLASLKKPVEAPAEVRDKAPHDASPAAAGTVREALSTPAPGGVSAEEAAAHDKHDKDSPAPVPIAIPTRWLVAAAVLLAGLASAAWVLLWLSQDSASLDKRIAISDPPPGGAIGVESSPPARVSGEQGAEQMGMAPSAVSAPPKEQLSAREDFGSVEAQTAANPDTVPSALIKSLQDEAAKGDAEAQHDLALIYAQGRGVPKDYPAAAHWLREAALQGLANAQYNLAALSEKGLGVQQDSLAALLWYLDAAEQGHVLAQYSVGIAYARGRGILQDYFEAERWLRKAAEQGLARAQYELGALHENGFGVPKNDDVAFKWYSLASARGNADAEARVREVAARLTPDRLAEARALAREADGEIPAAPQLTAQALLLPATSREAAKPTPELISDIQKILIRLDFDPGSPDGIAGERTTNAIREYQEFVDLEVDGRPSEELLAHMGLFLGEEPPPAGR